MNDADFPPPAEQTDERYRHWLRRCEPRGASNYDAHQALDNLAAPEPAIQAIDGDLYTAYVYDHPFDPLYNVVIDHRDWVEDLSFDRDDVADHEQGDGVLRRWLEDRTDPTPRPLHISPSFEPTRLDAEEAILAHLLNHTDGIEAFQWLPAETFTSDLRQAVYQALRELDDYRHAATPETVSRGADYYIRPLTEEEALFRNRPEPAPYVNRLALTRVEPDAAQTAARELHRWDLRQTLNTRASTYLRAEHPDRATAHQHRHPQTPTGSRAQPENLTPRHHQPPASHPPTSRPG